MQVHGNWEMKNNGVKILYTKQPEQNKLYVEATTPALLNNDHCIGLLNTINTFKRRLHGYYQDMDI